MNYREEKDSMGQLNVPENALYGATTQRALLNFPITFLIPLVPSDLFKIFLIF